MEILCNKTAPSTSTKDERIAAAAPFSSCLCCGWSINKLGNWIIGAKQTISTSFGINTSSDVVVGKFLLGSTSLSKN